MLRAIAQEESRIEQIKAEQRIHWVVSGRCKPSWLRWARSRRFACAFPSRTSAEKVALFRSWFRGRDELLEKRLRGYRAIGSAKGAAPLGYAEPRDDLVARLYGDAQAEALRGLLPATHN